MGEGCTMTYLSRFRLVLSTIATAPIRFYQRFISPLTPATCRYAPSCSNYAVEAVMAHGIFKGFLLASWRVLRCNPWSRGGVDHVPPKGRWKPDEWIAPRDWPGHETIEEPMPMGLAPTETPDLPVDAGIREDASGVHKRS